MSEGTSIWPRLLHPAPDSVAAYSRERGKSPWADAVHLVWSLWIFLTPLVDHGGFTLRWGLITLCSYPVFLLLYAGTLTRSRRFANVYALAMVAMSLVLLPWYLAAATYFIYGCLMLRTDPEYIWRRVMYTAGLNGLFDAVAITTGLVGWVGMAWVAMLTLSFSLVIQVEIRADRQNKALRLSQEEVRRLAATAERERIGRDLHDLLGHTLSLITLKLELSRKLFDRDHEAARRELVDAEQVARKALAEVRAAVTGIRATDLAAELASAHLMLETSGVVVHYVPPTRALPRAIESVLAMAVREAATNIARHARATRADIGIRIGAGQVQLRVRDNGRGGVDAFGNGLAGMRERIEALGGRLHVDSPPGGGTDLGIELPLPGASVLAGSPRDADSADADASTPLLGSAT